MELISSWTFTYPQIPKFVTFRSGSKPYWYMNPLRIAIPSTTVPTPNGRLGCLIRITKSACPAQHFFLLRPSLSKSKFYDLQQERIVFKFLRTCHVGMWIGIMGWVGPETNSIPSSFKNKWKGCKDGDEVIFAKCNRLPYLESITKILKCHVRVLAWQYNLSTAPRRFVRTAADFPIPLLVIGEPIRFTIIFLLQENWQLLSANQLIFTSRLPKCKAYHVVRELYEEGMFVGYRTDKSITKCLSNHKRKSICFAGSRSSKHNIIISAAPQINIVRRLYFQSAICNKWLPEGFGIGSMLSKFVVNTGTAAGRTPDLVTRHDFNTELRVWRGYKVPDDYPSSCPPHGHLSLSVWCSDLAVPFPPIWSPHSESLDGSKRGKVLSRIAFSGRKFILLYCLGIWPRCNDGMLIGRSYGLGVVYAFAESFFLGMSRCGGRGSRR